MSFLVKKSLHVMGSRYMSSSAAPLVLSPSDVFQSKKPSTVFLDASWFMPNSPRNPYDEFIGKRIPGAQFLDLDQVSGPHQLGLKHMMPSERAFADACERFGIDNSSHVVIYDTPGVFSSPRALFMFRTFGHENSSIINGGLSAWIAEGFPVESGPLSEVKKAYYRTPQLQSSSIRNYEEMVSNSALNPLADSHAELVLDARARGRYLGSDPEPRPGLSSGHIPHSFSLPFNLFLQKHSTSQDMEYTTLLPIPEIRQALVGAVGEERANQIIQGAVSVVTTCGSGMTAAVLWLGLKLLGTENVALYDESWTGYAMRASSKIEKSVT